MKTTFTIKFTDKSGSVKETIWNNGGIGYNESETAKVDAKLKADNRVIEWTINEIK